MALSVSHPVSTLDQYHPSSLGLIRDVIRKEPYNILYIQYIDYHMVFFISYPLSALGHDISPRADRLKG
jgi:hypothetical protein